MNQTASVSFPEYCSQTNVFFFFLIIPFLSWLKTGSSIRNVDIGVQGIYFLAPLTSFKTQNTPKVLTLEA